LSRRKQIIEEHFDAISGDDDWNPRYNIAPKPVNGRHFLPEESPDEVFSELRAFLNT
jgi:hypothetical protein